MNGPRSEEHPLLGAYQLGVLEEDEVRAVDDHVATCATCREELLLLGDARDALAEVPPEAFLEGPPEDGDLLLARTLRALRVLEEDEAGEAPEEGEAPLANEPPPDSSLTSLPTLPILPAAGVRQPMPARAVPAGRDRLRRPLSAAAAVVLLAAGLGVGVLVGRGTAPAGAGGPAQTTAPPAGTRTVAASNAATGVKMTVTVTPARGWVRLHSQVSGIAPGTQCLLVVEGRNGRRQTAGSWVTSSREAQPQTVVEGSAAIAPEDVRRVDVVTSAGTELVEVSL